MHISPTLRLAPDAVSDDKTDASELEAANDLTFLMAVGQRCDEERVYLTLDGVKYI